ncbi:MAG: hypothetical protein IJ864_04395 [Alphaproteobacteria bacterium]|nr:hypothetical protein [Alphaproteobacteria bacterium]
MKPDNSHITLGKRVKKSRATPLKWQLIEKLPPDEVCVLALPGSNADDSKKANGFAKMIEEVLKDKKIPIYCVQYDLAERNFRIDREAVLARYGQENHQLPFIKLVSAKDKTYVPQYIRELYQKTLAPRLRDEQGHPASIATVSQRLNKLVFANHCQGSTVMLQLEHLLTKDMQHLGYSPKIQQYLLRQIHSVNVAPVTPYGVTKTTAFKFISLSDDRAMSVCTKKIAYIRRRKQEHENFLAGIKNPSLKNPHDKPFVMHFSLTRPTENETVFAVNNLYSNELRQQKELDGIEHTFDSYADTIDDERSKDGDQLSDMFRQTLNWLVAHAQKNEQGLQELPDIFHQPQFSKYIKRAQENRYEMVTKETKLIKKRAETKKSSDR